MRRLRGFLGGAISLLALSSCAKISDFREPYVKEVFMGALAITPSLKGMYPGARSTAVVSIMGSADGKKVTIYGIPKNEPFELLPKLSPFEPAPTVSGFDSEAVDRRTLQILGFSSMNELAEEFETKVTGLILRDGPTLVTKEPIVISAKAGAIRKYIPEEQLSKITRISDGAGIDQIDDDEMIKMYEINFVGQVTSIF